jgi:uncharacterized membrane protein
MLKTRQTHGKDGFVNRGAETTRLETFVDAAFAFAVTLLVVGGGDNIPANFDEFLVALKQVPAFALCFANIAFFWYAHYTWSRRYGLEDMLSTFLSLVLTFVVLVFVYPLKAIYSGAFNFVPGLDGRSVFVYSSVEDFGAMIVIFGVAFSSLSAIIAWLNWHALGLADAIGLSKTERFDTLTSVYLWGVCALVPLGSVAIELLTDSTAWTIAASVFYIAFGVFLPVVSKRRERQRQALVS